MSVTVTNLTLGPGTLYTGLLGAVEPADNVVNVTPPSSSWTAVGATMGGVTITVDQTYTELECDQLVDSVGRRLTKREFMISTQLAETTQGNLSLSLNGSTNAGSGSVLSGGTYQSFEPLFATSATQPTYISIILDGWAPGSFNRRIIQRKSLSTAKVEQLFAKDKQTVYPVTLNGHYVSSAIAPIHLVDELT